MGEINSQAASLAAVWHQGGAATPVQGEERFAPFLLGQILSGSFLPPLLHW